MNDGAFVLLLRGTMARVRGFRQDSTRARRVGGGEHAGLLPLRQPQGAAARVGAQARGGEDLCTACG